ncbi:MAG TPA: hypothetical protein VN824_10725 [Puia sp.]|nr:hypothetical protein [Puia sp.]
MLDPLYLEFDDNDLASSAPTKFLKEEIEGIRFGIKWISGYGFYIGRIYCIDIKNNSGKIIKLRLKSIYRIRKDQLADKYVKIANALLRYYFDALALQHIESFQNNQPIEILGVKIDSEGVLFDQKIGKISWNFLGTKRYYTYYTLFSEVDPNKYKAFEYLHHWNTSLLQSVVEAILKIRSGE